MKNLHSIANQFCTSGELISIEPHGDGLINNSYKITTSEKSYLFQQLNTHVFSNPNLILGNISLFYQHLALQTSHKTKLTNFRFPKLILTKDQELLFLDDKNQYWRMQEFIGNSIVYNNLAEAGNMQTHLSEQAGLAIGHFHQITQDMSLLGFHDTLPGFHIAPHYLSLYEKALKHSNFDSDLDKTCQRFIMQRQAHFSVLEDAKADNLLRETLIHGDPKLNNMLFDKNSLNVLSLIDLDTLKQGLIHYDIADAMRSLCNLQGESPKSANNIVFDLESASHFLGSYFSETSHFLSTADYDYLYDAIRLLPLELGTRFYTDHLTGNHYFKINQKNENLTRAHCQFMLTKDIENKEAKIKALINKQNNAKKPQN